MAETNDVAPGSPPPEVVALTSKKRITIRLDADVVHWFKDRVDDAGGGSYQRLINRALREYIQGQDEPLDDTLRRILREELPRFFY